MAAVVAETMPDFYLGSGLGWTGPEYPWNELSDSGNQGV
jgi:hypothetical protein